jgi:hypothetical protein
MPYKYNPFTGTFDYTIEGAAGTVTSEMILDGTILNADINASAAIVDTKLATIATAGKVSNSATTATNANTASAIVARDASGNFSAGTITATLSGNASTVTTNANLAGDVTSVGNTTSIAAGVIVDSDINASAGIVDTKLATIATALKVSNSATTAASANTASAIVARDASGNFTAGTITAALTGAASSNVLKAGDTMTGVLAVTAGTTALPGIAISGDTNTGIYSPGADQLAISTGGTGRLFVDASGRVGVGGASAGPLLLANGTPGTSTTANLLSIRNGSSFSASNIAQIDFWCSNSFGGNEAIAAIRALNPNAAGNNGGALVFATSLNGTATTPSERVRITNDGLVGIGITPTYQLQVSTDSAGKPSTSTWTIVSDERIKEDIELADLDLCYEAIKAIPLKRYKWRDEIYTAEQVTDRRKLGWIAQDVEAIFPKAVGIHEFKYNQVFEEIIIPAVEEVLDDDGNVITPAQPERIEKGELISEDVIEDCRDLNSDQLYAAMYGAVQKLMAKVELLEIKISHLQSQ